MSFDQAGNLYSTTFQGGMDCALGNRCGTVFELTHSNGGWNESILYFFAPSPDGNLPAAGVAFDKNGNLYGTTSSGGTHGYGTVYQLTPSGSGWTENVLHSLQSFPDGATPNASLLSDQSGNFYGTASRGGSGGGGTVFEMSLSNGSWTYTVLYSFTGGVPTQSLAMDAGGNLYGTTCCDGAHGMGTVFKLTHGSWTHSSLHDFSGSEGATPYSNVVLDANGNLYGTASGGGAYGFGVIWEITP